MRFEQPLKDLKENIEEEINICEQMIDVVDETHYWKGKTEGLNRARILLIKAAMETSS